MDPERMKIGRLHADHPLPNERWWWVDIGWVRGGMITDARNGRIVDASPGFVRDLRCSTIDEIVKFYPKARVWRLAVNEEDGVIHAGEWVKNFHQHRCRMCRSPFGCGWRPEELCKKFLCDECRPSKK